MSDNAVIFVRVELPAEKAEGVRQAIESVLDWTNVKTSVVAPAVDSALSGLWDDNGEDDD